MNPLGSHDGTIELSLSEINRNLLRGSDMSKVLVRTSGYVQGRDWLHDMVRGRNESYMRFYLIDTDGGVMYCRLSDDAADRYLASISPKSFWGSGTAIENGSRITVTGRVRHAIPGTVSGNGFEICVNDFAAAD